MINVNIHTRGGVMQRTIADSWGDLLPSQFAEIAHILFTETEPVVASTRIVALLLSLPKGKFSALDAELVHDQMLEFADFVHNTPCNITRNLFPKLETPELVFYGPCDGCYNLRAAEFHWAEMAMQDFYAGRNTEPQTDIPFLWKLLGILYRPAKKGYDFERNPDGDPRIPYNANLDDYHTGILQKYMPVNVAYATLLWYLACRAEWAKNNPSVFPEHSTGEDAPPPIPGYFMLMRNIAERGTYGDFSEVEQMLAGNMFLEFTCMLADNERMKQEAQTNGE